MKACILCVDDDKTILLTLKAELKRSLGAGIYCEIAESADEAWEILEELKACGIMMQLKELRLRQIYYVVYQSHGLKMV